MIRLILVGLDGEGIASMMREAMFLDDVSLHKVKGPRSKKAIHHYHPRPMTSLSTPHHIPQRGHFDYITVDDQVNSGSQSPSSNQSPFGALETDFQVTRRDPNLYFLRRADANANDRGRSPLLHNSR